MCWSETASVAMVALGGAATAVTYLRGEPKGIWLTLGYFTAMEALQATGYAVVDQCGSRANGTIALLSYLHIAFQPIFINLFALAIAPVEVSSQMRRVVLGLAGLASALLVLQLLPLAALGQCAPGSVLCGPAFCVISGEWHIGWQVPLNAFPQIFGLPVFLPYLLAAFVLPLLYGAWRFVVFHAAAGPILASMLTDNPNEWPAVWCLFSIGLILVSLSQVIRHRVMNARQITAAARG